MYHFIDNWVGNLYEFTTLREAKREAKNHTCGHCITIYSKGEIIATVQPRENPLP